MIPIDFIAYNYVFLLRFIRILRILRMFALFNKTLKLFFECLKKSRLHYSIAILIFTIFSGTILLYIVESPVNMEIHSLYDSFWYVMLTVATVGSVDIVPITPAGRLLSIILMLIGLVLFGMVTALIATWFIEMKQKKDHMQCEDQIKQLTDTVANLQKEIVELKELVKKGK